MRFFKRVRNKQGWLAFVSTPEGLMAASIVQRPGEKPAAGCALLLKGQGSDAIAAAARDGHAQNFHCTSLLTIGQYQLLNVEAPNVPREELKDAVRWRLKDLLDYPLAQATIDVLELPLEAGARAQPSLFVAAAPTTSIAPHQKMFRDAKVALDAIDIPELAQRNISALLEPEGRGLAMLCMDHGGAMLTVTFRGELYLSRYIELSLEQLQGDDIERRHQAFDRITLELQRSLDHFERQYAFISVARLILGPGSVAGLEEYLSSQLYTPVETLDLASIIDLTAVPTLAAANEQQRFLLALGAALRSEVLA